MSNWKTKLAEAIEAAVAIAGLLMVILPLLEALAHNPVAIVGLVLIALAAIAFYVTHNIVLGKTAFGKEKPVEAKKPAAKK